MNNLYRNYYIGDHHIDYKTDITPLILLISQHGPDLVGLELGVSRADSFMTLLDNCPNISKLIGVDIYQPYFDPILHRTLSQYEIEMIKAESYNKQKFSRHRNKIEFFEMPSLEAAEKIADESLDFIFIDADHTYQGVTNDLNAYYSKVKPGGLVCGHDYSMPSVFEAVKDFRQSNRLTQHISCYLDCYVWKK